MKLRARLSLAVAAAASVAIFVMAAAFWVIATDEQRSSDDALLLDFVTEPRRFAAETFGPGAENIGPRRAANLLQNDRRGRSLFAVVRLVGPDGTVLIDEGLPPMLPPTEPTLETILIDGDRHRMAAGALGGSGVLQVARNIEEREASLERLRNRILLGSLLGIGLAAALGAVVARRLSTPIVEVSEAARALATRPHLPSRIEVDRSDEVGDLADSFNQMLAALEVSRDQQQRLVADASHELRTPLTSLRIKIDLLHATPDLEEGQRVQLLEGAATELERLTHLVTELVDLATDPSVVDEAPVRKSIGPVAEAVVEHVRRSTGRSIEFIADDSVAPIRERMVSRAISNLVDNACKYSPGDSDVVVRVHGGRIEVSDRGEGIPADDLPLVFDRFYRSSKARTRPGNGIGLAIVQRVAELHDGEVWVRNNAPDPGATVGFSLRT